MRIAISSCLAGAAVRYDGGHKRADSIIIPLEKEFELVLLCPEVECGLPAPREAMQLVAGPGGARLVTIATGTDHTERMTAWLQRRLQELASAGIAGFVLKARSPSCATRDAAVVDRRGHPCGLRAGMFAEAVIRSCPGMPVEDEERLSDSTALRSYIRRVKDHRGSIAFRQG